VDDAQHDAPDYIELTLEESLDLLTALEDVRGFLTILISHAPLKVEDTIGPLIGIQYQIDVVRSRLGLDVGGDPDAFL
jgi:hypothetical protein